MTNFFASGKITCQKLQIWKSNDSTERSIQRSEHIEAVRQIEQLDPCNKGIKSLFPLLAYSLSPISAREKVSKHLAFAFNWDDSSRFKLILIL